MKLRLVEQTCGCSTVRGGQGLKACALLCLRHSGAECLPPPTTVHLYMNDCSATELP